MKESTELVQVKLSEDINTEETTKCQKGSVSIIIQVTLDCLF